jgi:hypothetical protein
LETDMTTTMRAARAEYFAANGFGADGGYAAEWVDIKLGPLPMRVRNTASRVRAVRYHDLHHILTGYGTDLVGEMEISAWELGAGCSTFIAAWVLNLSGMAGGVFRAPRRTFDAFVRGRRSRSLYGRELEPLLDRTVEDVRADVGVPAASRSRPTDRALFALALAGGLTVGAALLPVGLALGLAGAVTN